MKEYLLPLKIVNQNKVINPESLFVDKGLYPIHNPNMDDWKNLIKFEGINSFITIDFGQEMSGGIRIYSGYVQGVICKIRVRFGESLGEVNSNIGEKNSVNAHAIRDSEYLLPASGILVVGPSGFRFVRIDVLEDKQIYLRNIFCENEIYSGKQIYDYHGDDKQIKQIFNAAKRTIDLCSGKGYIVDGIKRDQLVWMGDMAPEIMALTTLYSDCDDLIINSLEICKKNFPLPRYFNDIATYSMWWIIVLNDLLNENKCIDYIKSNLDLVISTISQMKELIDEEGNLNSKFRYLVDWPTSNTVDEEVGIRIIFMYSLSSASHLLNAFNRKSKDIDLLRKRVAIKGFDVKEKKQVVALKYFAFGKIDDQEYDILMKDGPIGLSTFMSYYVLSAISSRDEKLAIQIMKEYYGAMLEKGATTFFEDFDMEWVEGSGRIDEINPNQKDIHGDFGKYCYVGYRHSLCHGWSSGVIKFIKEHC